MPNLEQFFHREMTKTYNCFDHAREVWLELTGEDLSEVFPRLQGPFDKRQMTLSGARKRRFEFLPKPVSPCLVMMQRVGADPHIGIFYDGMVLQLSAAGVEYQPMRVATRNFTTTRCYR